MRLIDQHSTATDFDSREINWVGRTGTIRVSGSLGTGGTLTLNHRPTRNSPDTQVSSLSVGDNAFSATFGFLFVRFVAGSAAPSDLTVDVFEDALAVSTGSGTGGGTGRTSTAGPKGEPGDTGVAGPKGDMGDQGDQGDQGPAGAKGDQGDSGTTRYPENPQYAGGSRIVEFEPLGEYRALTYDSSDFTGNNIPVGSVMLANASSGIRPVLIHVHPEDLDLINFLDSASSVNARISIVNQANSNNEPLVGELVSGTLTHRTGRVYLFRVSETTADTFVNNIRVFIVVQSIIDARLEDLNNEVQGTPDHVLIAPYAVSTTHRATGVRANSVTLPENYTNWRYLEIAPFVNYSGALYISSVARLIPTEWLNAQTTSREVVLMGDVEPAGGTDVFIRGTWNPTARTLTSNAGRWTDIAYARLTNIGGGTRGEQGPKGDQGDPGGPQGPKGDQGDQGDQGVRGPAGAAGAAGAQGAAGPKGDQGDQGATGPKGDQGDQGPAGAAGTPGTAGTQGIKGDQGDRGPAGAAGSKGDQGDQGTAGLKGEQGDRGPAGAAGAQGPQGNPGTAGAQGAAGPKGDQGDRGPAGPTIAATESTAGVVEGADSSQATSDSGSDILGWSIDRLREWWGATTFGIKLGRYPENPQDSGAARLAPLTLIGDYAVVDYDLTDYTANNVAAGQIMLAPLVGQVRSFLIHLRDVDVAAATFLEEARVAGCVLTIRTVTGAIVGTRGTLTTVNQNTGNVYLLSVEEAATNALADATAVQVQVQSIIDARLEDITGTEALQLRELPLYEANLASGGPTTGVSYIGTRPPPGTSVVAWVNGDESTPNIDDYFTLATDGRSLVVNQSGHIHLIGNITGTRTTTGGGNARAEVYIDVRRTRGTTVSTFNASDNSYLRRTAGFTEYHQLFSLRLRVQRGDRLAIITTQAGALDAVPTFNAARLTIAWQAGIVGPEGGPRTLLDGSQVFAPALTFAVEGASFTDGQWRRVSGNARAIDLAIDAEATRDRLTEDYATEQDIRIGDIVLRATAAEVSGEDHVRLTFTEDFPAGFDTNSIVIREHSELASLQRIVGLIGTIRGGDDSSSNPQTVRRYPQNVVCFGRFADSALVNSRPPTIPPLRFDDNVGPYFLSSTGPWHFPDEGLPTGSDPLWRAELRVGWSGSEWRIVQANWIYTRMDAGDLLFATDLNGSGATDAFVAGTHTHFTVIRADGTISGWVPLGQPPETKTTLWNLFTSFSGSGASNTVATPFRFSHYSRLKLEYRYYESNEVTVYGEAYLDDLERLRVFDGNIAPTTGLGMIRAAIGGPDMANSLTIVNARHGATSWVTPGLASGRGLLVDMIARRSPTETGARTTDDEVASFYVFPGFGGGRIDLFGIR